MKNNNELTLNELESVTGGAGFTASKKTPKYAAGTMVRFNHETYGNEIGVIESIEYLPDTPESLSQYPDGYVYVVRNSASYSTITAWLIAVITESQITRVVLEPEA